MISSRPSHLYVIPQLPKPAMASPINFTPMTSRSRADEAAMRRCAAVCALIPGEVQR